MRTRPCLMLYVIEMKLGPMCDIATAETYLGLIIQFMSSRNQINLKSRDKKINQIEFSQKFQGAFL